MHRAVAVSLPLCIIPHWWTIKDEIWRKERFCMKSVYCYIPQEDCCWVPGGFNGIIRHTIKYLIEEAHPTCENSYCNLSCQTKWTCSHILCLVSSVTSDGLEPTWLPVIRSCWRDNFGPLLLGILGCIYVHWRVVVYLYSLYFAV